MTIVARVVQFVSVVTIGRKWLVRTIATNTFSGAIHLLRHLLTTTFLFSTAAAEP